MDIESCKARINMIEKGTLIKETDSFFHINQTRLELKEHQKKMVRAMIELEDSEINLLNNAKVNTSIGICGDIAGAGKSLEILTLINHKKIMKPKEKVQLQFGYLVHVSNIHLIENCIESNLIIVPHACVSQWTNYIKQYTNLSFAVISRRKDIISFKTTKQDIVLCSSSMYNNFIDDFKTKVWSRVIIDEADSIPIPNMIAPLANFIWFVTSSVQNLMFPSGHYFQELILPDTGRRTITRKYIDGIRRNGFISETFKMLERKEANLVLHKIVLKNNNQDVNDSFELPSIIKNIIKCKTPIYLRVVSGLVNNEIMQMLNAGNISGALERTSMSTDTTESIISNVTNQYVGQLHNLKAQYVCAESMTYSREVDKEKRLEHLTKEIFRIENIIKTIEERISNYHKSCCPICMDDFENPTAIKCCQNVFCFECITRSIEKKPTCPMCRSLISNDNLVIIGKQRQISKEEVLPSKNQALVEIITNNPKGKFLIFSSHDQSFIPISEELEKINEKPIKLLGSGARIDNILDKFKNTDNVNILLLNSQHYGSGLNLENTTDLIFYHKMPKDLETQVIGRAHRFGRNISLKVHYLFQENELHN